MFHSLVCGWTVQLALGTALMLEYLCDNIGLVLACLLNGSTNATASPSRYMTKPSGIPSLRRRLAACRLGVACVWVVCVRTHMRVVKMAAIACTVRREKRSLALQRSSFRENPTYFLTSVRHWVCELVFDAIYDWRSEFSHDRQNE